MDKRILRFYSRELQHLREVGQEFANDFPKIAGRLGMEGVAVADPYVERLMEGFAFLTARVQLKLDSEFPRFTNYLLETVYPHYLAPTPSMLITQFQADMKEEKLTAGYTIPRQTSLKSRIGKGDQTACEYRTAHEVQLWPFELTDAQYYVQDVATLNLPEHVGSPQAAVRLRLKTAPGLTFSELDMDVLNLYLTGGDEIATRLYEQFFGHGTHAVVRPITQPTPWQLVISSNGIKRRGYDLEDALLPYDARSFHGYRLLHEYFAFPQRFLFADLHGLGPGIKRCEANEIDVIVVFNAADYELEDVVSANHFKLFCTPAINLFPLRADRIHVTDKFSEFHVLPDRTRPMDFEVYRVNTVTGFGDGVHSEREFRPFYAAADVGSEMADQEAFFAVHRVSRALSDRAKRVGPRSSYGGSEVYLSLVDAKAAPIDADIRQLGMTTLCTNRDLPLRMPTGQDTTDFTIEAGLPIEAVRVVTGPTPPCASFAEGETSWRLISHLSLNYLSLMDTESGKAAAALRQVLQLYADLTDSAIRKQIDGVKTVTARPIIRRVPTPGPITFARGLEVSVTLEDDAFEGIGTFLMGSVLEQFFDRYVSINSFTETVVNTTDRKEIMRWPSRFGRKPTL